MHIATWFNASQGEIMSAKQSAETKHAMHLHLVDGKSIYEAAKMAGIYASTLYRALKNKKKKESTQKA
jgi:transposase